MSVCDSCLKPGHCCRAIPLSGGGSHKHGQNIEAPRSFEDAEHYALRIGMANFRPLMQQEDGAWLWWCTWLDEATGRCMNYDNRPYLCRSYAPGHDRLCFHYWEDPRGEVAGGVQHPDEA